MRTLLIAGTLIVTLMSAAGADTVTGLVRSAEDDSPLEGATVYAESKEMVVKTDSEGRFTLQNVSGPVSVIVSHVGFAARRGVLLRPGEEKLIRLSTTLSLLNTLVVTANRYEKEAYKVSQPITVAGSHEIETKGHTIVSDVIRGFPGVDMNDAGPFRARPVIRGLYGTRILVLVDGERLNDHRDVADFAGVSMSLVDVNEIERVEVVNGPSSVLYGSDAMAGVINIITRKNEFGSELTPFARYSGRYSTADEQHSNRFDIGMESEKFSLSLGAQYREARKDFAPPDGWQAKDERYDVFRPEFYDSLNEAQGRNFSRDELVNSRARVNNYDAKFGWRLSERHRVDLDFGAFRGNDIGYPGVPNENTPYLFCYPNHDRDNFSINYTGTGLTGRMARLESKLYYEKISKHFLTDFLDAMLIQMGPSSINPRTSLSETEVTKMGVNIQGLYQPAEPVTMTFGVDSWREEIDGHVTSNITYTYLDTTSYPPSIRSVDIVQTGSSVPENSWHALGAYASSELNVRDILLTAGLRLDNFWISTEETEGYVDTAGNQLPTADESYTALNGSLGLVHPIGSGVNVVANVGTAYRIPNVVERFYYGSASGRETRPNPDIKPERSFTVDFGVKAVHSNVNYSLIGFRSGYRDFSQLHNFEVLPPSYPGGNSTRLWRYENVEDVTIYGFESVVEGHLDDGLYGSLSFSYQRGDNNTHNQPIFVSPIKTSLTAGYRHSRHGLFGELTVRRVEDQDRIPDVTALDDIATKGFTVVNATAGVRLFEQVRLSMSVNNIFDEVYSEPFNGRNVDNPIAESGRNLVLSVNSRI